MSGHNKHKKRESVFDMLFLKMSDGFFSSKSPEANKKLNNYNKNARASSNNKGMALDIGIEYLRLHCSKSFFSFFVKDPRDWLASKLFDDGICIHKPIAELFG